MRAIGVGGVIQYGIELLVYHLVIYLIGGLIMGIGVLFLAAGAGSVGALDPGILLGAGIFLFIGWIVIVAGELGIVYKVIADSVMTGMSRSQEETRSNDRRSTSSRPSLGPSGQDQQGSNQQQE